MQNIQNLQEIIYVMGANESKKKNYQYYYRRNIHETEHSQIFRINSCESTHRTNIAR